MWVPSLTTISTSFFAVNKKKVVEINFYVYASNKIVKEEEKLLEIDKVVKLIHLCRSDSFIAIFPRLWMLKLTRRGTKVVFLSLTQF